MLRKIHPLCQGLFFLCHLSFIKLFLYLCFLKCRWRTQVEFPRVISTRNLLFKQWRECWIFSSLEYLFQDNYVIGKIVEVLRWWRKTTSQVCRNVSEKKSLQLAHGAAASVPLRKVRGKRQPLGHMSFIHWDQEIVDITSLCSYWGISNCLRIGRLSLNSMTPIPIKYTKL